MNYDKFGVAYISSNDLCDLLYQNPDVDFSKILVQDSGQYNTAVNELFAELPILQVYNYVNLDIHEYDQENQANWHMPEHYQKMDIAQWLLDQCKTNEELQRVGQELLLYQERNLFQLLKQLKYIVDTWRSKNIVWGVGRGSSVASYVLYLLGVHKINSIYYDLDVNEFLR